MSRLLRPVLLAAGVCASAAAGAVTAEFEGNFGVGHTDNLTRLSGTGQRSATMGTVGLNFSVREQTRRINADVGGDLSWLYYDDAVYSSELIGNAAGRLQLGLVEERVFWVVEDSFGQVRQDLFSVPNPLNRENVNRFSTGPDARFQLGASTSVTFAGRWTLVDYEVSPEDTERMAIRAAIERTLSSTARLSLNASNEDIDPRGATLTPSYRRSAAYLGYALDGRRSSFVLEAGGNRISGGGFTDSGPLVRVQFTRLIGTMSQFTFRVGHAFTDSGTEFGVSSGGQRLPDISTPGTIIHSAQGYTNSYANADWSITGRRTSLRFFGGFADQDYEAPGTIDLQQISLGVAASRQLGARMELSARIRHERDDFGPLGENEQTTYNLALSRALGQRARAEVAAEHFSYASSQTTGAQETRYWFRLHYGLQFGR